MTTLIHRSFCHCNNKYVKQCGMVINLAWGNPIAHINVELFYICNIYYDLNGTQLSRRLGV
jgi:hypothetical protein